MGGKMIALPGVGLLGLLIVAFVVSVYHAARHKNQSAGAVAVGLLVLGFCSMFLFAPRSVVSMNPSTRATVGGRHASTGDLTGASDRGGPSAEVEFGVGRAEGDNRDAQLDGNNDKGHAESAEQMAARLAAEAFDKAADDAEARRLRQVVRDREREAARWERQALLIGLVVVMIASGYGFLSASTRGRRRPVLQIGSGVAFAAVCALAWLVGRHF